MTLSMGSGDDRTTPTRSPFAWLLILLFAAIWLTILVLALVRPESLSQLVEENGAVELGSAVLLAVASLMFLFGPYDLPGRKWMLAAVCALFLVREFDVNWRIARDGFLFFPDDFKGVSPYGYMAVETVSVIAIVALLVWMAWSYRRVVMANLKRRDAHQIMLLMVWVCVGLSLMLDGLDAKVRSITGDEIGDGLEVVSLALEEGTEMMIPVCIILGLLEYYRTRIWSRQAPRYRVSP